jgi:SET and MYND domain-containing protein
MNLIVRKEIGTTPDPRWAGLEGHADSLKKQKRWDEVVLQAKAAIEFTKSPESNLESGINVLCRMTTNAFRATLADNTPIGLCFEPVMSLANHSCTPNATIMFDGRKIELRALADIKKDEQIFISYIDPTQAKNTRQDELKGRYFFTCECEECVQDDNAYATFLKTNPAPFPKLDLFFDPKELAKYAISRCQR